MAGFGPADESSNLSRATTAQKTLCYESSVRFSHAPAVRVSLCFFELVGLNFSEKVSPPGKASNSSGRRTWNPQLSLFFLKILNNSNQATLTNPAVKQISKSTG